MRAIIVDMDGTLALKGDRSPFDYSKVDQDDLNEPIALIVKAYKENVKGLVIILSGRESSCLEMTEGWLKKYNIPVDKMYMRKIGDHRKDSIIKKELYDANIKPYYKIDFVLDDRNQVVDFWRSQGLTCLQVAPGDF